MSRTRRSAWTFAASLARSGGMMLAGLLTTPLLLRWLGDERLGAFRTGSDWLAYLGLLELGLGASLQAMLARAQSRQDSLATCGILSAAGRAYVGLTVLALAAGALLTVLSPWLIPVQAAMVPELRLGMGLAVVPIVLMPLAVFRPLMDASQRGYFVHGLLLGQAMLGAGLSLLFAWRGWGLLGQFLAVALGSLLVPLVLAWDGVRRFPQLWLAVRTREAGVPWRKELWALNWPNVVQELAGRLSLMSDSIVVSALLGPAQVVPFTVSQRLVALAGGQSMALGTSAWPALAELHYRGEHDLLRRRLLELTRLTVVLTAAAVIPTALFAASFVRLWVGAEWYAGPALPWLAAVNAIVFALVSVWGWLFGGTGKVRLLLPVHLTQTVVNVVVSILATWAVGLPGPLLGTFVGYSGVSLWWIPVLLWRHFGVPPWPLAVAILGPLLLAVAYALAMLALTSVWLPSGWATLAGALSLAAVGYLCLAWLVILDGRERALWRHRVASILVLPRAD